MLELKLQYFGHLMQITDSLEKTWILGKIEGRRRKGLQDKIVGWHHRLNGSEFEQAPGDGEGQESLVCCSPWGHKDLDTTEQLNNPGGSEVKASACNAGDLGSIPGSGRSPGEGNGNPLQYSCLEKSMGLQRVGHDWVTSLSLSDCHSRESVSVPQTAHEQLCFYTFLFFMYFRRLMLDLFFSCQL